MRTKLYNGIDEPWAKRWNAKFLSFSFPCPAANGSGDHQSRAGPLGQEHWARVVCDERRAVKAQPLKEDGRMLLCLFVKFSSLSSHVYRTQSWIHRWRRKQGQNRASQRWVVLRKVSKLATLVSGSRICYFCLQEFYALGRQTIESNTEPFLANNIQALWG